MLLPDSNINELLSHGYVRYRIKPLTTLSVGDSILNSASIFFDFNAPIYTNTAVTEIVLPTFIPEVKEPFDFSLFPNPTTSEMTVSFSLKQKSNIEIKLYNSLGQHITTITDSSNDAGNNTITFSTANLPPGIYHLQFSVDGEVVTKKVVKM